MQRDKESKEVQQNPKGKSVIVVQPTQINPSQTAVISQITPDDSNPVKPVIETFFIGTYVNAKPNQTGARLFYAYFDIKNDKSGILDLVGAPVTLDGLEPLQITPSDPNTQGGVRAFRNYPERWVSNANPLPGGHYPTVGVSGGADTATGTFHA